MATPLALRFYSLDGPPDRVVWWRAPGDAEQAIEEMARHNAMRIRAGEAPPIESIRYVPEDGMEELLSAPLVAEVGYADCEDVVAYRLGEYYAMGNYAPRARIYRVGPNDWHAVIEHPTGSIEDVSSYL